MGRRHPQHWSLRLLVSVTGYGYESFSYTWLGNGLWSQEWGMFLLPLAWGIELARGQRHRGEASTRWPRWSSG